MVDSDPDSPPPSDDEPFSEPPSDEDDLSLPSLTSEDDKRFFWDKDDDFMPEFEDFDDGDTLDDLSDPYEELSLPSSPPPDSEDEDFDLRESTFSVPESVNTTEIKAEILGTNNDQNHAEQRDDISFSKLEETQESPIHKSTEEVQPTKPSAPNNHPESESTKPERVDQNSDSMGQVEKPPSLAVDPAYSKYLKMAQVGLPLPSLEAKMKLDGINPIKIDELLKLIPNMVKVPSFAKFERVAPPPKPEARNSLVQQNPTHIEQQKIEGPTVSLSEHPVYSKYFKMMKVGLPRPSVETKMTQEGFDPWVLDFPGSHLVAANEEAKKYDPEKVKKPTGLASIFNGKAVEAAKNIESGVRKKKLFWKGLDADKVSKDSLWASQDQEGEVGIELDQEEFNRLFVESKDGKKEESELQKNEKKAKKSATVHVIDMKRVQNGGISLARIKLNYEEIREKILKLDDSELSIEQLMALSEFLPTTEETKKLLSYTGDPKLLGKVEQYMIVMSGFISAKKKLNCMIFRLQFPAKIHDSKLKLSKIESACDGVKNSKELQRLLKTILKVGNQLNDDKVHHGFTLDSLLKLNSAKAFDKKTSVLQYVIILLYRHDESALNFPATLHDLNDASRLQLDPINNDKEMYKREYELNYKVFAEVKEKENDADHTEILEFFAKAKHQCEDLEKRFSKTKHKFISVLNYFGEDPGMQSHEFFSTLSRFVQEFSAAKEQVDRIKKAEQRKQKQAEAAAAKAAAKASLSERKRQTLTPQASTEEPSSTRRPRAVTSFTPRSLDPKPSSDSSQINTTDNISFRPPPPMVKPPPPSPLAVPSVVGAENDANQAESVGAGSPPPPPPPPGRRQPPPPPSLPPSAF